MAAGVTDRLWEMKDLVEMPSGRQSLPDLSPNSLVVALRRARARRFRLDPPAAIAGDPNMRRVRANFDLGSMAALFKLTHYQNSVLALADEASAMNVYWSPRTGSSTLQPIPSCRRP
jgi:hypothetical protein